MVDGVIQKGAGGSPQGGNSQPATPLVDQNKAHNAEGESYIWIEVGTSLPAAE